MCYDISYIPHQHQSVQSGVSGKEFPSLLQKQRNLLCQPLDQLLVERLAVFGLW